MQEAAKLWTWAAERGNAYAQFDLAGLHMTGTGVPRDLVKAYSLFTLAGKTLDVSKQLSELSSRMSEDELAKVPSQDEVAKAPSQDEVAKIQ